MATIVRRLGAGLLAGMMMTVAACAPKPQAATNPLGAPKPQAATNPFGAPKPQAATNPFGAPKPQAPTTLFDPQPQKPFSDPQPQAPSFGAQQGAKQRVRLTDSQVLTILTTATENRIQAAELARRQATSADVKQFAAMVITLDQNALQKAKALLGRHDLAPAESALSRELDSKSREKLVQLRAETGKDFDRDFLQGQIDRAEELRAIIDEQLISDATLNEVKRQVTTTRRTVVDRAQKARQLATRVAK